MQHGDIKPGMSLDISVGDLGGGHLLVPDRMPPSRASVWLCNTASSGMMGGVTPLLVILRRREGRDEEPLICR